MKADAEVYFYKAPFPEFTSRCEIGVHIGREAEELFPSDGHFLWEQLIAIILGYANPVEL